MPLQQTVFGNQLLFHIGPTVVPAIKKQTKKEKKGEEGVEGEEGEEGEREKVNFFSGQLGQHFQWLTFGTYIPN